MNKSTFISHKGGRWAWITGTLMVFLIVWYFTSRPIEGASGGTFYGYTVGGIATGAVLLLTWFGVRKRSYNAHHTSVQSWLSSHVWIGLSLILMVPLHAGFRAGLNIHTFAYVVMLLVIISGIWGVINYRTLPRQTLSNRGGGSLRMICDEFDSVGQELELLYQRLSDHVLAAVSPLDFTFVPRKPTLFHFRKAYVLDEKQASDILYRIDEDHRSQALKAIELIAKKASLARRISAELSVQQRLKLWLYFHVPLTLILLSAIAIHIFSVFYF